MKFISANKYLFIAILFQFIVTSCEIELSRSQAEKLIREKLDYPYRQTREVNMGFEPWMYSIDYELLVNEGVISTNSIRSIMGKQNILSSTLTNEGQKYLVGTINNYKKGKFITAVVDFGEITGIAEKDNYNMVKVEYTYVIKDVTPFGRAFRMRNGTINNSVYFTKYDDGWRVLNENGQPIENRTINLESQSTQNNVQNDGESAGLEQKLESKPSLNDYSTKYDINAISEKANALWSKINIDGVQIKGKCSLLSFLSEGDWLMIHDSKYLKEKEEVAIQTWMFKSDTLCYYESGFIAGARGNLFSQVYYYFKDKTICINNTAGTMDKIECDSDLKTKYLMDSKEIFQLYKNGKLIDDVSYNCNN